jgi:putative hemolysin
VGITLAGVLGSAFAADNFSEKLTVWVVSLGVKMPQATLKTIAVIVITIILSYFTLVLGELVPKRIGMKKAEQLGLGMSGMIYYVAKIFAPLVWFLTASTNLLLRILGIDPNGEDNAITEEEIRMMVDVGSEKGAIDSEEKEIIQNLFEFDDKTADEIMTHRIEMTVLWLKESDAAWKETIGRSRYSNYPVCGADLDDVAGVLKAKDYFRLECQERNLVMEQAVKAVQFVPETVRADILFQNMKKRREHFAVVLDEYGGTSGIITMNDLLEELVGDLEDDADAPKERPVIEVLDDHTWKIQGSAPLHEVAKVLKVKLPVEQYETFSGMAFGLLGEIPDDEQKPEVEGFGLAIQVMEIQGHIIQYAIVRLIM